MITLTLNDKTEFPVFAEDVDGWKDLYPAVDVMQELRAMKGWLDANPTRRKTKNGIRRFVNSWLSREQDSAGRKPAAVKEPARNNISRFNNFPQRDYDMTALERALLAKDYSIDQTPEEINPNKQIKTMGAV